MKRIVLVLAFFLIFKPMLPVLEYVANYEYISKVLCINKEKPKLKCNGKCHLIKELAKISDTENPISSSKKMVSHELELLFFEEIKSFKITSFCLKEAQFLNSDYSDFYFYLNSDSVFRPPILLS